LVGSPDGTKVAYITGNLGALHLFAAAADFTGAVDLGPVPDWSPSAPLSIGWAGNAAVAAVVDTISASSVTSLTTVYSATDATVLYTTPQHYLGWLN
ncbi:MAG: hypothetical protein QOG52_726, partial [Frankiaceae bacterium]|nr:hypothetical protein [Frankiaceae bacterium]